MPYMLKLKFSESHAAADAVAPLYFTRIINLARGRLCAPVFLYGLMQLFNKYVVVPGFCNEILRAELHGLNGKGHIAESGDKHHRRGIAGCLDALKPEETVAAVETRAVEIHVKHNRIKGARTEQCRNQTRVAGSDNFAELIAKHYFQCRTYCRIIVYYKNLHDAKVQLIRSVQHISAVKLTEEPARMSIF